MSFYDEGVDFECKRCGNCCTRSGYVFIFQRDLDLILEKTNYSRSELEKRYLSKLDDYVVLKDQGNGACIFWDDYIKGCKIYEARPTQCRTFPFWNAIMSDEESWINAMEDCPGIGQGNHFTFEEIEKLRKKI
ncbi:MAG: YkgJ family cysteine cluster protein [Candidatus Delongbacteria bacterium]|nr:YkgJ family cysteine cluster protein [Candidatus Delongbacteria bacterium]